MRLFFALWPPAAAAKALAGWARAVQKESGGKALSAEKIHLTLAFLGKADPDQAGAAAREVVAEKFEMPLDAARYWPHNRIVWIGAEQVPAPLGRLAAQLHAVLRGRGFALEDRPFAAHLTLVRKAGRPAAIPPLPPVDWPVEEFVLARSQTLPAGSQYEILDRFPLAGAG